MLNHAIYKTPDEVLSQNVGIAFARDLFNNFQAVEQQDIAFSWGTYGDSEIRLAVANLFLYFNEVPAKLPELKKITEQSFSIEADNLVEQAGIAIPVAVYPVTDIRIHLRQYFDRYYDKLKNRFKRDFNRDNPHAEALDWQVAFTTLHTPTYVYNKAVDYLDRYAGGKGLDSADVQFLQVEIRKYLRKLFLGED